MAQIGTNIEQSKKLLQLGLNPETADMCHHEKDGLKCIPYSKITHNKCEYLPAWSLTALLSLISDCKLHTPQKEDGQYRCYDSTHEFLSEEPVDAVFQMFVCLALEEAAKIIKDFHDKE